MLEENFLRHLILLFGQYYMPMIVPEEHYSSGEVTELEE